jgi:hypothetical protein
LVAVLPDPRSGPHGVEVLPEEASDDLGYVVEQFLVHEGGTEGFPRTAIGTRKIVPSWIAVEELERIVENAAGVGVVPERSRAD